MNWHAHVISSLDPFVLTHEQDLDGVVLTFEDPTSNFREPTLFAETHPHRCVRFQIDRWRLFVGHHNQVPAGA